MNSISTYLVSIILLFNLVIYETIESSYTPVVMYHGMGDTAYGSIESVKTFLENKLTGIYVTSIQMGSNAEEDFFSSYLMNLNKQVEKACSMIKADSNLKNGYNAIGFSQGGQILRAIAQRCPEPPMKNLISLGGQHQGVYGLPKCLGTVKICNYVREMLNFGAYVSYIQDNLVQAEYWHDPLQEQLYRNRSIFLADINNEKQPRNESYKTNLIKLKNLVLVQFLNDTIVQPKESSWFQFYQPGQAKIVYKLQDSPLYKEDWIGLKQLDQTKRLKLLGTIGDHLQFHVHGKWFNDEIVEPYLST